MPKRIRSKEHLIRKALKTRERRKEALGVGLCGQCKKTLVIEGRKQCQRCIDIGYLKYLTQKEHNHDKLKKNIKDYLARNPDWQKNYYEKNGDKVREIHWLNKRGVRFRIPVEERLRGIKERMGG